jgi:guanosine-3',5'-bis(diphosphate) 3'-pyrophosphohydrolase
MPKEDGPKLVEAARKLCVSAHNGQTRANGKPYHTHPFAVAQLLAEYGMNDPEILAAAYLHDVLEDTKTSRKEIAEDFGKRVAKLVEEMTIDAKDQGSFEAKQTALLSAAKKMSQDAKWIKLADRVHNLREKLPAWSDEKRRRYSQASLNLLDALMPWPSQALADEVRRLAGEFAR